MSSTTSERIPISKFGLSSTASAARNAKLLHAACGAVDPDTVISVGQRFYPLDQGVVRIARDAIAIQGPGADRGGFRYTSTGDTEIGVGSALTILGTNAPDGSGLVRGVRLSGLGFRDENPSAIDTGGHNPAAVDALFVDDFAADGLDFQGVKGNSALNVLGLATNDTTPVSQSVSVTNITGGDIQGDLVNVQGFQNIRIAGLRKTGPLGRHFIELGAAIGAFTVEDCVADMQGQGGACLASFMCTASGIVRRSRFDGWGPGQSAIQVHPDLLTLPVVNLTVEDTGFASRYSGLAAIAIVAGALRNHVYQRNQFRCVLPLWVHARPDGLTIDDNDFWPDMVGRALVLPVETPFVGVNRIHPPGTA